jgi:hypothetical protein
MLSIGQVTIGTVATHLCNVPGGPCLVTVTNDSGSAASAYLGITGAPGTAAGGTPATVTTTNSIPVPAGTSLVFANYKSSPGASLSVISSGSAVTVGFLISTSAGGTGL